GGDAARMIEALADSIDRRLHQTLQARAAGSGAKLSGRMVAGLPLLLAPMVPLSQARLTDPAGILLLVAGSAFAVAGLAWIEKLFPRPPNLDDGAAALADRLAGILRAGASLEGALAVMSSRSPADVTEGMQRAARLVRLGAGWPEALLRSRDPSLRGLGTTLRQARALGLPLAGALELFARTRREAGARRFEEAIRRAPVKMMVPLTLCVLPAFVLLGLGPFLRSLAMSG
ncbi:MAG: type II secretion system F family protein, partial [Actinomycetota bacterium]